MLNVLDEYQDYGITKWQTLDLLKLIGDRKMGDEISQTQFSAAVFEEFRNRLDAETVILQQWVDEGGLHCTEPWSGSEVEAWLIDNSGNPLPDNKRFLESLNNKLVVPELAKFNIELNTEPLEIKPGFLETMHSNMSSLWQACEQAAAINSAKLTMIGVLPTVTQDDLCMENQSEMKRYQALNEQIFRLRNGDPLHLIIEGNELLDIRHHDVMLEAAATSFQIHYKVDIDQSVVAYNASRILSAPLVAIAANSPYLFGHDLWSESRIPLFEQAVKVGGSDYASRVSFGLRHAQRSIMECFEANRRRYPTLLPQLMDTAPEELAHLRLHNGTVWRWNRPLIGFDDDGKPHLRIEQRVPSAGPSLLDMIANAAFYYGALTALISGADIATMAIPNRDASRNFYACARNALNADVTWVDKKQLSVTELLLDHLLPLAERGLISIGYSQAEARYWLDILKERVSSGQNGATWQRSWIAQHGRDFQQLVIDYQRNQASDAPVHTWNI